jgi:hypothetical protein
VEDCEEMPFSVGILFLLRLCSAVFVLIIASTPHGVVVDVMKATDQVVGERCACLKIVK